VVLSREEVQQLFDAARKLKERIMLMTTYAAGLRVSETVNLKLTDIE
jgi:site-specific recombinase XerD